MGDRGNIIVKDVDSTVYLYTHWTGSRIPAIVRKALKRGERWEDGAYLARILFCELLEGDLTGSMGYGISSTRGDGGTDVVVDVRTQRVDGVPFAKYIKQKKTEETE